MSHRNMAQEEDYGMRQAMVYLHVEYEAEYAGIASLAGKSLAGTQSLVESAYDRRSRKASQNGRYARTREPHKLPVFRIFTTA
jgi:hypothetical protein